MIKRIKRPRFNSLSKRQRAIILPIMVAVGTGAVVLSILLIIVAPHSNTASQYGVGADGFRAYVEQGTSLGIDRVVSKADVVANLGNKAKSVSNVSISKVFNLNGDRGQTATFNFVRSDGVKSSLYVDVMEFKNLGSMDSAHVLAGTGKAGTIQGHTAYFVLAQTIGSMREYRLLVINGLKAYKFVIDQPVNNIKINEVSSVATLIRLAQKAHL